MAAMMTLSLRPASSSNDWVEKRDAGTKGFGLFARKAIPKGTRILEEEPLVKLPPGEQSSRNLWKKFKKLSEAKEAKFWELSFVETRLHELEQAYNHAIGKFQPAELAKMNAIFESNCVAMGTKCQYGIGVFEFYSRINHSCVPNVHNSYNPDAQREVVHAVKDIAEDEEILTSYVTNVRCRADRQAQLRKYGFQCACDACHGPDLAVHEFRRQQLSELDQMLALKAHGSFLLSMLPHDNMPDDEDALFMALRHVTLLKEEGLHGMDLAMSYRECATFSIELGKLEDALEYARQEREVEVYCLGSEEKYMLGDADYALTQIRTIERKMQLARCDQGMGDFGGLHAEGSRPSRHERPAQAKKHAMQAKRLQAFQAAMNDLRRSS